MMQTLRNRVYQKQLLALTVSAAFMSIGATGPAVAQTGTCVLPRWEAADEYLDVGNVRARILNFGNLFWNGDPFVYEVPKGSGLHSLFSSSFWLGGKVDSELRVATPFYASREFWPGPLTESGEPPVDCDVYDRVWSIYAADIRAFEEGGVPTADLQSWPTGLGAPTVGPAGADGVDNDQDGIVDESDEMKRVHEEILRLPLGERIDRVIDLEAGERPEMIGDQMLWWIMNDAGNEHRRAATPPIGVEIHGTAFAFRGSPALENTTFHRMRIYMKRSVPLKDAYAGWFVDADVGGFQDDYVGSDTTLRMGFAYNAEEEDDEYGMRPPAVGYDVFRGPTISSASDTALVAGISVPGSRNLQATSFMTFALDGGLYETPHSASDHYLYMQGLWGDGSPIREYGFGFDGGPEHPITKFIFSGDPVNRAFWSEFDIDGAGASRAPGDRSFVMSSGPFRIEAGGYQELIYGIVWARGADYLDSISELRDTDRRMQAFVDNDFELPPPPDPPDVELTQYDQAVAVSWSNAPSSNNAWDGYRKQHPLATPTDPWVRFEGYEVWQFSSDQDTVGKPLATFDVGNGVTVVNDDLDGDGFVDRRTEGRDSGVRHSHLIVDLTNYRTYHFGVRAYAHAFGVTPAILYSDFVRGSVVPAKPSTIVSDAAMDAWASDPVPDFIAEDIEGTGSGDVTAVVVNPVRMRNGTYRISFYDLGGDVRYNVERDDSTVFDGSAAGIPAPQRANAFVADGLEFSIVPDSIGGFQAGDVFELSTVGYGASEPDLETQRARLAEIGIVPNPYKSFSDYEVDLASDEVRFTGLPDVATIRVFTLHGTLVRTLQKDSPGLRSLSWDVRNEDGRKLASGMYLIHVEVPGVGERVIKFAMVKDGVVE